MKGRKEKKQKEDEGSMYVREREREDVSFVSFISVSFSGFSE